MHTCQGFTIQFQNINYLKYFNFDILFEHLSDIFSLDNFLKEVNKKSINHCLIGLAMCPYILVRGNFVWIQLVPCGKPIRPEKTHNINKM